MENREIFSSLTTIPPVFVRLDGRAFHRFTDSLALEKPFDEVFHSAMVTTGISLVADSGLNPDLAYTFSDEISLYFTKLPFSGRVEKIDSVAASYAASSFTLALGGAIPVAFDARVIPATPTPAYALEYLANRQAEAWRNHINAYCQHALIGEGMDSRKAAKNLKGMKAKDLHEMMHIRGINLAMTPAWQRRGTLVYKKLTEKEGFNPITKETVIAERSSVVKESELPLFTSTEGKAFLAKVLGGI